MRGLIFETSRHLWDWQDQPENRPLWSDLSPRVAWAPGHQFTLSLLILGRVGRPTLYRHQGCSATRGRAYSREWCAWLAPARTRGESITNEQFCSSSGTPPTGWGPRLGYGECHQWGLTSLPVFHCHTRLRPVCRENHCPVFDCHTRLRPVCRESHCLVFHWHARLAGRTTVRSFTATLGFDQFAGRTARSFSVISRLLTSLPGAPLPDLSLPH